ncbi:MAG: NAD kinase [Flavobacteriales bacterium]|nr:NAD kinase [Flavobacteriales bacterium]
MKFAIYGRIVKPEHRRRIQDFLKILSDHSEKLYVHRNIYDSFDSLGFPPFESSIDIAGVDILISFGGDGTLLDAAHVVQDSLIPIVGVNTGRLGFLSSASFSDISKIIDLLENREYHIDARTMINLEASDPIFGKSTFALNEVTVLKQSTSSMVTVHTFLNEEYLNSYWADGLIIGTPSGSTAYSLSCGGPIIIPGSGNFVLTPIAPHNLNVRPLVIPDESELRLKVEGRSSHFLLALDTRSEIVETGTELILKKCQFPLNIVRFRPDSFLNTLRKKLHWGLDERN